MRKLALGIAASLVLVGVSLAVPKDQTFRGEIMDSQCSAMGSHDMMLKKGGVKDAKECTQACVKMGGKYVLYDAAKKTVYQLDDQKKPEQFAGEKVKVTGTLDTATKTIHVSDIQAAK
jgi:hypothetical protein